MDLKEWEKLSPEEQQRRLEEKPIESGKCAAGLIELRNSLKREIEGEDTASSRYMEASIKLRHYSKGVLADELKNIATQEMMHHYMIKAVVNIITEECGE